MAQNVHRIGPLHSPCRPVAEGGGPVTPPAQRLYRAACPGCGAPVEFRSAQSTHAVCAFCRSTVVRSGDVLSRIGRMAEIFQDYSPLQLMAAGRHGERGFTVVGRLQYRSDTGVWSEWHLALDDGSSAVLAEDNGSYVFMRPLPAGPVPPPPAGALRVGATTAVAGLSYGVTFNGPVSLIAAEGELSRLTSTSAPFAMAELRSEDGRVLSIDYDTDPPTMMRGAAVRLEELQLTGLRDAADSAADSTARQFACPNCGAPVAVQLDSSKAVTCPNCRSIIDLSAGIGGELRHALQDEPVRPAIALGATGTLQGAPWQVLGFQHRLGREPGEDGESFGWSEYLLYHRQRGFRFLVDASDGWSLVQAASGAPKMLAGGDTQASYLGTTYTLQSRYSAETTYVLGEFYWPVERGQKTDNADYINGRSLLSRERTRNELTWSVGSRLEGATVAAAFGRKDQVAGVERADAAPLATGRMGCATIVLLVIVIVIVLLLLGRCSGGGAGGGGYRSSGGSYGGSSSGGGHK